MPYIDSNVFIYPIIYDPKAISKAARAQARLTQIARGELDAYTSPLTWDEITWVAEKLFGRRKASSQGASFVRLPNLKILSVDTEVLLRAQTLYERYEVKPRDAVHAATALANRITDVLSDDVDFEKIPQIKRIPL